MQPWSTLPAAIIKRIASFAINSGSATLKDWKVTLPLLHVCSLWRKVAAPIIYSSVYFDCQETFRLQKKGKKVAKSSPLLLSNAQLCLSTGNMEHVTGVVFNINSIKGFDYLLEKHIELLNPKVYSWTSVTKLKCSMDIRFHEYSIRYLILNTGSFVAGCFANLNNIRFFSKIPSLYVNMLYESMACKCFQRLHSLDTNVALDFSNCSFGKTLTKISIPCAYGFKNVLQKIDKNLLKCLKLSQVPVDINWKFMRNNLAERVVSFSVLQRLELDFINGRSYLFSENGWDMLSFPSLRHLVIKCNGTIAMAPNTDIFPQTMESITLIGPVEVIAWWNSINIGFVNTLNVELISATRYYHNSISFADYDETSKLFGQQNNYKSINLKISDASISFHHLRVNWQNVTSIEFTEPICITSVIVALQKMPKLIQLSADHISCTLYPDFSKDHIKNILRNTALPINSSIRRLKLFRGNRLFQAMELDCENSKVISTQKSDKKDHVFSLLTLKLPSLEAFCVNKAAFECASKLFSN